MAKNRKIEEQIVVFGESDSGKTVLVSSLYGATQQQAYKAVPDKQSQDRSLYQAYLGMRESATVPLTTRFDSKTYAVTVRAKDSPQGDDETRRPFDAVQIAWHDYPGEWFAQDLERPQAHARVAARKRALELVELMGGLVDNEVAKIDHAHVPEQVTLREGEHPDSCDFFGEDAMRELWPDLEATFKRISDGPDPSIRH